MDPLVAKIYGKAEPGVSGRASTVMGVQKETWKVERGMWKTF
jgi:hypothetical protein